MKQRLATALFLSFWCATALCAEFARVPGTQIELVPPDGFAPSNRFPGFSRPDLRAGIEVTEIPGPYSQVRLGLESKEGFAEKGMTLAEVEHLRIAGVDGVLSRVTQEVGGISMTKLMAAFGDESHTATIVGVFRNDEPAATRTAIRNAILTARWSTATPSARLEGLPFTLTESPRLKIRQRVSTFVQLRPPESATTGRDPMLTVATAPVAVDEQQIEAFAKQQLQGARSFADVHNFAGSALRIDGLPAFELTADARFSDSDDPLKLYELMIVDAAGQRCFFAMGYVRAAAAAPEQTLADFRAVAHTLKVQR